MNCKVILLFLLFSLNMNGQYLPEELVRYEKFRETLPERELEQQEKIDRQYNADGKLIKESIWHWRENFQRIVLIREYTFEYKNGVLQRDATMVYAGNLLAQEIYRHYEYEGDCLIGQENIEYRYGELKKRWEYTFEDCDVKLILEYQRRREDWRLDGKREFVNFDLISGQNYFRMKSGQWERITSDFREVDERGNVLKEENFVYTTNNATTRVYSYDQRDNLIKRAVYNGSDANLLERILTYATFEYDLDNRIIYEGNFEPTEVVDSLYLASAINYEYVLDEEGNIDVENRVEKIRYNEADQEWSSVYTGRVLYQYYCDGLLKQKHHSFSNISYDEIENYFPRATSPCTFSGENIDAVLAYPNPVATQLTIRNQFLLFKDCQLTIHNANGKIISQEIFSNRINEVDLDVSALSAGIYFIELSTQGEVTRGKFVKI